MFSIYPPQTILAKTVQMDIIIISLSRWDGNYSSTILSLAKVFARNNRVFYIDNPFTIKDFVLGIASSQIIRRWQALLLGRKIHEKPLKELPDFVAVTPSLTIPINWLPKGKLYNFLSSVNNRIVFGAIRKTIRKYRIRDFVFLNSFNPHYANNFPSDFKPRLSVYHCVDDISNSPYVAKHGTRLEEKAISRYGMTLTTSSELTKLKSPYTKNIHMLPNAANVGLFQAAVHEKLDKPIELQPFPEDKQFVVYTGNICHRLDYELLIKIADNFPERILIMVGPYANDNYKKSGLNRRKNVIFTGRKRLEELPAYLQHSHCAIIPFLCIQVTKSIYPLKINEYLSAGKPVVTTPFSDDVIGFKDVAYVAGDHGEFLRLIDQAIAEDDHDRRNARTTFSSSNSWENRAEHFWSLIENFSYVA